jgi:NADH dehydrogenase
MVRRLVALGKPVRAMVGNPDKALKRLADIESKIEIVKGDVTRPETLTEWMKDIDVVIHLVAIAIEKGKRTYEAINTQGTVNVLEAAKAAGVTRFLNMCQAGATPDHFSRFLRSKGLAQDFVATSGLNWTAFRPSVIWGPQDEFANVQARLIQMTPIIFPVVGDGKAKFQPVYVGDVVEAFVRSIDDPTTYGQEYELGGPEVLEYQEIVKRVLKAMGTSRALIKIPVPLLRPAVIGMQTFLPAPPVSTTLLELLAVPNIVQDNALISKFGIQPRAFSPENLTYMKDFNIGTTLGKFFGRATEEKKVVETVAAH